MQNVKKEVLDNGLTILTEQMPAVRSVSVGVWLKTGSRSETKELNGVTHFVEHLLFKGTTKRSAEDIAKEIDSIGGYLDAFTGKETTCYNAKILDEHLPLAIDILSDLVLNPRFDPQEMERERAVILEEIKMVEDTPDDLVYEIFTQNLWKNQPLGRPILGTAETINQLNREKVVNFFHTFYRPSELIVAAAGNVDHEYIVDLLAKTFSHLEDHSNGHNIETAHLHSHISTRTKKELEQVHICLGVPATSLIHKDRFIFYVLNTILGAGMSSRLFQKIREKQGLAYAIFSGMNSYRDTGCLSVYAGTSLENFNLLISSVMQEFHELKYKPVPLEELCRAKEHLKGSLLLGLESTSSRMSNLARQELYFGKYSSPEEMIFNLEQVTTDDVQKLANLFFKTDKVSLTVLGNLDGLKLDRTNLDCGS